MTPSPSSPFVLFPESGDGQVLFALDSTDDRNPVTKDEALIPVSATEMAERGDTAEVIDATLATVSAMSDEDEDAEWRAAAERNAIIEADRQQRHAKRDAEWAAAQRLAAAAALNGDDDSIGSEPNEDDLADPDGGSVGPDFTIPVGDGDDFPPSRQTGRP